MNAPTTTTEATENGAGLWSVVALVLALMEQLKEVGNMRNAWRHNVLMELKRLGGRNPGPHIAELIKLGDGLEEGNAALDATARHLLAKMGEHAPPEAMEFFKLLQPELSDTPANEGGGYPHLPNHDHPYAQPPAITSQAYAPDGREGALTAVDDTSNEVQITFPDGSAEWFPAYHCTDCETQRPLAEPPAA